jgi:sec-independent protein translocase protein TatA
MIPNIGPLEIAIVVIIALVVFGPKRLPELGRSLGSGITEFKDGLSNPKKTEDDAGDQAQLSESLDTDSEAPDPDSEIPGTETHAGRSTG